jgi:hypothetical protein
MNANLPLSHNALSGVIVRNSAEGASTLMSYLGSIGTLMADAGRRSRDHSRPTRPLCQVKRCLLKLVDHTQTQFVFLHIRRQQICLFQVWWQDQWAIDSQEIQVISSNDKTGVTWRVTC